MTKPFVLIEHEGGKVKVEAFGYKGGKCKQATGDFLRAVGLPETSEVKPDFYKSETSSQKQTIQ